MNKKYIIPIVISLIFCFLIYQRSEKIDDVENITLYAASDSGDDTVTSIYMNMFADKVEKLSQGKVKIKTYSSGTVGGDLEILEACKYGNIDFVFQTSAVQTSLVKEAEVFDIPSFFDNIGQARKIIDEKLFPKLEKAYDKADYVLLGIADQGFRLMTSNKPVYKMEDFRGIRIRTMESSNHIKLWKSLGANPTPMSYSEVYVGLQQGTIDAQENPLESIIAPRFYEQQAYLIETNHLIHPVICIGSKKVFDELPSSYQEIIRKAALETKDESRDLVDIRNKKNITYIQEQGVKVINHDPKLAQEMGQRTKDLREEIKNHIGDDLYKSYMCQ